jgi:divinyl chlorophyllide a 8-vinyl-reductase
MTDQPLHVLLLGATGTIGRATALALRAGGHQVTAILRAGSAALPEGVLGREADVSKVGAVANAIGATRFDAVISCLASRTGAPEDALAIDYKANSLALRAAQAAGIQHFVLLSAICVQRPLLEFQHAKLAFEAELQASGLRWSVVRPTAFFKSLSGQVARVQAGKPFLVFGNGQLTACKPISDADLARYLVLCLTDPALENRILPIGGPGPAMTPLDQAQMLFALTGQPPRIRRVPVALMTGIIACLSTLGRLSPALARKANLARIGRYYATQSMLVLNPATAQYDADATPEFGTDRLADHYAALLRGEVSDDRGAHAVF